MTDTYKNTDDIFNAFDDELCIPSEYTGRLIHTYIDETRTGVITDYMGNECKYAELSAVHLEPSDYNLSIADEFIDFITGLKGELFNV